MPLNHRFFCGVKVTEINATCLDCGDNLFCSRHSETTIQPSVLTRNSHNFNLLINTDMENVISECLWKCQVVQLTVCLCVCLLQEQTEEQLKKEKAQCEELREYQSALEKDKNKLSADLKALSEKNEKVSLLTSEPKPLYIHFFFFNQSNIKICCLKVYYVFPL